MTRPSVSSTRTRPSRTQTSLARASLGRLTPGKELVPGRSKCVDVLIDHSLDSSDYTLIIRAGLGQGNWVEPELRISPSVENVDMLRFPHFIGVEEKSEAIDAEDNGHRASVSALPPRPLNIYPHSLSPSAPAGSG